MADEFTLRETTDDASELSFEDIEAAYLRALEAADAAEAVVIESPSPALPEVNPSVPPQTSAAPSVPESASPSEALRLSQEQVLESLLFVGGDPLPTRRLGDILGCDSIERIEEILERLALRYDQEGRPYEVRLVEGGYELSLRPEFDSVRNRVFGQGPREVKLSQDALEILAFVAYQQPVTLDAVNATEKPNAGSLLRQLIRRELVALHRGREQGEETYHTTPRFLQLFGLATLDDLPLAVDFEFK